MNVKAKLFKGLQDARGVGLQGNGEKEGLKPKRLTASLFIKEMEFMQKRIKLVAVLIHERTHMKRVYMVNGRQVRTHLRGQVRAREQGSTCMPKITDLVRSQAGDGPHYV
eukprot:817542-Pelagomonas_calceolata.AAC.1